ncbi:hypothetical protein F5887DRAFT_1250778 [Amanita rubescens]|nr:hypothetical protein F5887DRAFT_1250778 [Amanita rubescens]
MYVPRDAPEGPYGEGTLDMRHRVGDPVAEVARITFVLANTLRVVIRKCLVKTGGSSSASSERGGRKGLQSWCRGTGMTTVGNARSVPGFKRVKEGVDGWGWWQNSKEFKQQVFETCGERERRGDGEVGVTVGVTTYWWMVDVRRWTVDRWMFGGGGQWTVDALMFGGGRWTGRWTVDAGPGQRDRKWSAINGNNLAQCGIERNSALAIAWITCLAGEIRGVALSGWRGWWVSVENFELEELRTGPDKIFKVMEEILLTATIEVLRVVVARAQAAGASVGTCNPRRAPVNEWQRILRWQRVDLSSNFVESNQVFITRHFLHCDHNRAGCFSWNDEWSDPITTARLLPDVESAEEVSFRSYRVVGILSLICDRHKCQVTAAALTGPQSDDGWWKRLFDLFFEGDGCERWRDVGEFDMLAFVDSPRESWFFGYGDMKDTSGMSGTLPTVVREKDPSSLATPARLPELSPLCIPAVPTALSLLADTPSTTAVASPKSDSSRISKEPSSGSQEDGELEDSKSSDVEIFLSSLGLENAVPSAHTSTAPDSEHVPEDVHVSPTITQQQKTANVSDDILLPQLPPAPLQKTIPLQDVTSDSEAPGPPTKPTPSQPVVVPKETTQHSHIAEESVAERLAPSNSRDIYLNNCINIDSSHKTPNVYINGLPPHFPEEQLYALAAPFGAIRSVRTFTRHVKESESGCLYVSRFRF